MTRHRPTFRPARHRGLTLIELILVMLIMALALAIVAPSLRAFAAGRETADAAASLVAITNWARMQAVTEGRPYRLNFDLQIEGEGYYWLTAQDGATFELLGKAMGRRFELPKELRVEWIEPTDAEQQQYIQFEPNGRSQIATLRLTGRLGTVYDVICDSPTERFRVEHRPAEEVRDVY